MTTKAAAKSDNLASSLPVRKRNWLYGLSRWWLFLIVTGPMLFAGDQIEEVEIERGVSYVVSDLLQDRYGFIWIGTYSGLLRYDGTGFTLFEKKPSDESSLISNWITKLFEDREGRLWVGTEDGVCVYDRESSSFNRFESAVSSENLIMNLGVKTIAESPDGTIWVGSNRGLHRLEFETEQMVPVELSNLSSRGPNGIHQIYGDRGGRMWVIGDHGLSQLDPDTSSLGRPNREPRWRSGLQFLCEDSENMIWVSDEFGLARFDPGKGRRASRISPPLPPVLASRRAKVNAGLWDSRGRLWLATEKHGLWRFEPEQRFWRQIGRSKEKGVQIEEAKVLFEDRGGIIWVGSMRGVYKVRERGSGFEHVYASRKHSDSLSHGYVNAIWEDRRGELWVGTYHGLNRRVGDGFKRYYARVPRKEGLVNSTIYAFAEDRQDRLWVGTNGGIHRYLRDEDRFEAFRFDPRRHGGLPLAMVYRIVADPDGGLWLGGGEKGGGLVFFDPDQSSFTSYHYQPDDQESLSDDHIIELLMSRSGSLWVGTVNGLSRVDRNDRQITRFSTDRASGPRLSNDIIISLHEDPQDRIWIGTDVGLNVYDPERGTIEHFFKEDGLPSNAILGITHDDAGYLWLSHGKGLTRYQPETREAVNYDLNDGLGNRFGWGRYYQSPSGTLYFGGFNGFNYFNPATVSKNQHIPPTYVTRMRTMKSSQPYPVAPDGEQVFELSHQDNYVTFAFAGLDYEIPEKNLYSYKLEGLTNDWSVPSSQAWATFTDLDPGNYVFRVRASNNDGVWNEDGASLSLVIVPPWWQTPPAYLFYAFLIPTVLLGGYRLRVKRLRDREQQLTQLVRSQTRVLRGEKNKTEAQAKKLLEMDRLKTEFFSNVSHEFRTPLTLIMGPLESVLDPSSQTPPDQLRRHHEVMLRHARRLLRLINQLLDLSKLDARKMKLAARKQDLAGFISRITHAFQSLAEKRGMTLEVNADGPLMVWFDPGQIEKVMYNLLSNAFQFTSPGGSIWVRAEQAKNKQGQSGVCIDVQDTGEGIEAASLPHIFDRFRQVDGSMTRKTEGTGIGLSLVKELVTLHHGTIQVDSIQGEGSTFSIWLPLGADHLAPEECCEKQTRSTYFDGLEQVEMAGLMGATLKTEISPRQLWGETVLVVDDHADIRAYIRSFLGKQFRILEAADGVEGLDVVRRSKPSLVISDIMMPRMDGYELCRRLKADRRCSEIPVILLTAKASDEMKLEGLEVGADDYLSKPFNSRELEVRVRNLLALAGQTRKMRQGLEMARKAQLCMLPGSLPSVAGLEVATFCEPAREVGGDYYDFLPLGDQGLGFLVGDVSGKGMAAALYMTMTKGLVQAYAGRGLTPGQTLAQINRQFHRASATSMFMSLAYTEINPRTMELTFANAGHNPLILHSPRRGETLFLKGAGMAIGLNEGELFDSVLEERQVSLHSGDVLVGFTDGISEIMNPSHQIFSEERLVTLLKHHGNHSAADILRVLIDEVLAFCGDAEPFDDMTLVVIRINGNQSESLASRQLDLAASEG